MVCSYAVRHVIWLFCAATARPPYGEVTGSLPRAISSNPSSSPGSGTLRNSQTGIRLKNQTEPVPPSKRYKTTKMCRTKDPQTGQPGSTDAIWFMARARTSSLALLYFRRWFFYDRNDCVPVSLFSFFFFFFLAFLPLSVLHPLILPLAKANFEISHFFRL